MKNIAVIAVIVAILGALIVTLVYYKREITKITKTLESERYSRLVAEEKVVNSASKIKQLEGDLKSNEDKIAKVQSLLKDQKNFNKDLETQYERLARTKIALEEQLKTVISQPLPPVLVNETVPSN